MQVGNLTQRVIVQQPSEASNGQGGATVTWSTLATVWASVVGISGSERLQAESVGSRVGYRVTVRYRADVTPRMRLSWTPYGGSAKTLEILAVRMKEGSPVFLELDCEEVA